MQTCYTLLFFLSPIILSGQNEAYKAILNDPDVIWAAELDLQFTVEPEYSLSENPLLLGNNISTPLKLLNVHPGALELKNILLATKLLELCRSGKQPAFNPLIEDALFDAAHRREFLNGVDTITVIDPETTMEYNQVVFNDPGETAIVGVRVLQLLYYREKSAGFNIYTAAFAPIFSVYSRTEPSVFLYMHTPYWFQMPPWSARSDSRKPKLNSPNITWARRLKTLDISPTLNELQPLKDFKPPIMQQLLDRFRHQPDFTVAYTEDGAPIPFESREAIIHQTDTIATYDPDTYEEKMEVRHTELTGFDITHLALSQDWFWDEKQQQLIIRLHAFAPMFERKDATERPLYRQPLFWKTLK